jgi:hypothetical protein
VHQVHPGHDLEQLAEHLGRSSDPTRRHVEFAGIGFGIGDKLGKRLRRNRLIDLQDTGCTDDAGDRHGVADEIEIEVVIQRRVDRTCRAEQKERVAIRRRAHGRLGGDIGGGAGPVLDDERLAEAF